MKDNRFCIILQQNAIEGLRRGQNLFADGRSDLTLLFCKLMALAGHGRPFPVSDLAQYLPKVENRKLDPDNKPEGHGCMGFEPGDTFTCNYSCPAGFCPKTMFKSIYKFLSGVMDPANMVWLDN